MDVYLYERSVIMIKKYMAIMLAGLMLASIVVGCKKSNKPADNESISTTMEDIKDTSAVDETEEDDTSEITEETTTEVVENETTKEDMEEETSATEEITTECESESETEPVTEPSLESETETESHSSEYEQEITTTQPTEAPTTKPVESVTQPPTTEVPTTKEPETTPKPTEPPTTASKENVYVFNDDGTIDFKKSKINNYNDEFVNYVYQSNEVKNILGEKLYNSIYYLGLSIGSTRNKPAVCACINNEYWLVMHFDENWNICKGRGKGTLSIYNPDNLPIKEDW